MITIEFFDNSVDNTTPQHTLIAKIMHFRQYENAHQVSQCGGNTVMIFGSNKALVAKCHTKDRFSRRKGILTCIQKYLDRFYPIEGYFVEGVQYLNENILIYVTKDNRHKYWWC